MNWVGLYGVAWICSGVCLYGIFFSIFILKETKGKNLNTTDDENWTRKCQHRDQLIAKY